MANRIPSLFLWGCAAVVLVACALRFPGLGNKPIHADESVHAWKVGHLLDTGEHHYDPAEYHGPTLHFLGAGVAWVAGERSSLSVRIATLRLIPALAGVGVVVLTLLLYPVIGRGAAFAAGAFTATSPLLVYYSRHFIQEQLVVLFTAGAIVFSALWLWRGKRRWAAFAGLSFGLVIGTKETWPMLLAASTPALLLVARDHREFLRNLRARRTVWQGALVFLVVAAITTAAIYSNLFTYPHGLIDFVRGLFIGAERSSGGAHDKPWSAYAAMLLWHHTGRIWWSEAGIALFALAGMVFAFFAKGGSAATRSTARFLTVFTVLLALFYSSVPYKIIWLACGFWHGAAILAGVGVAWLASSRFAHIPRFVAAASCGLIVFNLGAQARRATGSMAASPRNPYAYVTTSRDILRLHDRLEAIAAQHPRKRDMVISVGLPEYWPLPWLLRDFPNVAFALGTPDNWDADVFLLSPEAFDEMPLALSSQMSTELFGLRDGVLVVLATDTRLWKRSLPAQAP